MDGRHPWVRWAVLLGLAVMVTGCFPGHEPPPTLDGPRKSFADPACHPLESFTPLPAGLTDVQWTENVEFVRVQPTERVVVGDVTVTISNVATESSTYTASGGATWSVPFPYDTERAFGSSGAIVTQMSWYHAVGIGDEIGDSATVVAAIEASNGRVRWWYPYSGQHAPPRLLVVGREVAIVLVFYSPIPCTFVHAIDLATGDQRWAVGVIGEDPTVLAGAFGPDVVHLSLAEHGVVDLDLRTGDVVP